MLTLIPNLRRRMSERGATIHQLTDHAGVSEWAIRRARDGGRIGLELAGCIVVALETRRFHRLKMGPRC